MTMIVRSAHLWAMVELIVGILLTRLYGTGIFCPRQTISGTRSQCPTLAQHHQKFAEYRLPILCRYWNDNSGMYLAANSGPNSGRQHLFLTQQRANAVPKSGFLTSRMVSRGKSDTWHSSVPSVARTLALLLLELDAIIKVTIGLV